MDIEDVAGELGMTVAAVRNHIHRGHAGTHIPPFFRLGRAVRWHREVVDTWLRDIAGLGEKTPAEICSAAVGPRRGRGRPTKAELIEGRH